MPLALAALPVAMIGLFALLLLFGVSLLVDALLSGLRYTRILAWVADLLEQVFHAVRYAVSVIIDFLASVGRAALTVYSYPARGFIALADITSTAIARVGSWTRWVVRTAIPSLWAGLYSSIANVVHNLSTLAYGLFNQAINLLTMTRVALQHLISASLAVTLDYSRSLYNLLHAALGVAVLELTGLATNLFRVAMTALAGVNTTLTRLILNGFTQATTYALALAQWAVHTATGISIDWARKYSDQLIDLYDKAIAGGVASAIAPAWPTAIDAIDNIVRAYPGTIADVLGRIGAIPRTIPRDLAINVGAVAAVGTIALDWVNRCGISLCRNTKKFGEDLSAIEDAALIIAIFDLVIDGIEAPEETAHTVHGEVSGPLAALGHEFTSIVNTVG